jgi:hypothetical protein
MLCQLNVAMSVLKYWIHELRGEIGAGNETRTRDPDLGKVVLYQLSYSRNRMSSASDLERETRLELATPTLARSCSTN